MFLFCCEVFAFAVTVVGHHTHYSVFSIIVTEQTRKTKYTFTTEKLFLRCYHLYTYSHANIRKVRRKGLLISSPDLLSATSIRDLGTRLKVYHTSRVFTRLVLYNKAKDC